MKVQLQFEKKPLLFKDPKFIIACYDPALIRAAFRDIEFALSSGYYLAGFLAYEAGYVFEKKLYQDKRYDFPLVYLGAYKGFERETLLPRAEGAG